MKASICLSPDLISELVNIGAGPDASPAPSKKPPYVLPGTPKVALVGTRAPERVIRSDRLSEIRILKDELVETGKELKHAERYSYEKTQLFGRPQAIASKIDMLETSYKEHFVPQHSPNQLINHQELLRSKLFNVKGRNAPREAMVTFEIGHGINAATYHGPELRQADALVFMGLVNMVRDIKVGTLVSFEPSEMCRWLYTYYDGDARTRLRESIHRLQHALLRFESFSVQLAQKFTYPKRGPWSVMLDPDIVRLFATESKRVWLDFELRRTLPDGLTSWLYTYIESQTRLIPQPTQTIQELCGSDACDARSFQIILRRSLKALVERDIIDDGFFIKSGTLHWIKGKQV